MASRLEILNGNDDLPVTALRPSRLQGTDVDPRVGQPSRVAPELARTIVQRDGQHLAALNQVQASWLESCDGAVGVIDNEMQEPAAFMGKRGRCSDVDAPLAQQLANFGDDAGSVCVSMTISVGTNGTVDRRAAKPGRPASS